MVSGAHSTTSRTDADVPSVLVSNAPSPSLHGADPATNTRGLRRARSAPANMRIPSKLLLELLQDPITLVVLTLQLQVTRQAAGRCRCPQSP